VVIILLKTKSIKGEERLKHLYHTKIAVIIQKWSDKLMRITC